MALVRVYYGLALTEPSAEPATPGNWLTVAGVDDSGRLLDICEISDDQHGYAALSAMFAERVGSASVAVATESDDHQVVQLLCAAGRPVAVADEELVHDYAERFTDEDSLEEINSTQAQQHAVGLARALQAGALIASTQPPPRELINLKPLLTAHAAMAAGRSAAATALREVLREVYPAALRAYPDPAAHIPMAVLEALPEPGLLSVGTANRGREAAVAADLVAAGIGPEGAVSDAVTALRVAISETPRRTGLNRALNMAIAEAVRQAVGAVRACDAAAAALISTIEAVPASATGAGRPPSGGPAHALLHAVKDVPGRTNRVPLPRRDRPAPTPVSATPLPPVAAQTPQPAALTPPPVNPRVATPLPTRTPTPMPTRTPAAPVTPAAARTAPPLPTRTPRPVTPGAGTAAEPPSATRPGRRPGDRPASAPPAPPSAPQAPAASMTAPSLPASAPPATMPPATMPPASAAPHAAALTSGTPPLGTRPAWSLDTPPTPQPVQRHAAASASDPTALPTRRPLAAGGPLGAGGPRPTGEPEPARTGRRAAPAPSPALTDPTPTPLPSREGRVMPPWQADDLPAEPQPLRLVEPSPPGDRMPRLDSRTGVPPLRLVEPGRDARPPAATASGPDRRQGAVDPLESAIPPAAASDDDGDLLIFAAARSAWFTGQFAEVDLSNPIDYGWRAAEQAAEPKAGEPTVAGLPRRVPQANLVPGSPLPPQERSLHIVRDPAAMAAHTMGYFRGSRRGEEVRGYAVGGRPGRQSATGWDFSREGDDWENKDQQHNGFRPAAHR